MGKRWAWYIYTLMPAASDRALRMANLVVRKDRASWVTRVEHPEPRLPRQRCVLEGEAPVIVNHYWLSIDKRVCCACMCVMYKQTHTTWLQSLFITDWILFYSWDSRQFLQWDRAPHGTAWRGECHLNGKEAKMNAADTCTPQRFQQELCVCILNHMPHSACICVPTGLQCWSPCTAAGLPLFCFGWCQIPYIQTVGTQ